MRKNLISSLILVVALVGFSTPVWAGETGGTPEMIAGTGETPYTTDTAMQPNPNEIDEAMGPPPGE